MALENPDEVSLSSLQRARARLGVDVIQRKFISNNVKHNTVKYARIQAPSSRRIPLEGQTQKTEA